MKNLSIVMGSFARGQGSFEFLMGHAWAIIVVILVGTTLYGMGEMNGNNSIASVGFVFFKLIQSESGSRDGHTILVFQTTVPKSIEMSRVESDVRNLLTGVACPVSINPVRLSTGDFFKVETDCMDPSAKYYELQVRLRYYTNTGGVLSTGEEVGIIKGEQIHITDGTMATIPTTTTEEPPTTTTTMTEVTSTTTTSTTSTTTTEECYKNGGGYTPYERGSVIINGLVIRTDYCRAPSDGPPAVIEFVCTRTNGAWDTYGHWIDCPAGCNFAEGACYTDIGGKATIGVSSQPYNALFYVDGTWRGYTPMVEANIPPGSHTYSISLTGYQLVSGHVTLAPNEFKALSYTLVPE